MSLARQYPFPYKTVPNIGILTCSGLEINSVTILSTDPPPNPPYTLVLPTSAGSNGQVLSTNGSGILSWVTVPPPNPGTVTSVSASVPAFLSVSVSNPTTTPIINITLSGSALPITSGGTGLTSVGTNGQVLTSNGTALYFATPTGGTVTSVSASVPSWLSVTVTNPTTTPNIAITGSATGTGTVTVLKQSPTIDTLSVTTSLVVTGNTVPTVQINRTSGNGKAMEIHNTQAAPQENWIEIGHDNGNVHNRALFGHNYLANNSNTNYAFITAGGNELMWDGNYTLSANQLTIYPLNQQLNLSDVVAISDAPSFPSTTKMTITTALTQAQILFTDITNAVQFSVGCFLDPAGSKAFFVGKGATFLRYDGLARFTFPTVQGTNGQILTTTNTGVTSWITPNPGTVTSVSASVPAFLAVTVTNPTSTPAIAITLSGTALPTTSGGTGLITIGTAGQVLTSNGTSLYYTTPTVGTVTSVSASVPSWLSVTVTNATTTPNIAITGTATGTGTVTVLQNSPTITTPIIETYIDVKETSNNGYFRAIAFSGANYIQSGITASAGSAADLYFTTISATATWMTIKSNGLVGIGTTSPNQQLEVYGTNARVRIDGAGGNGVLELRSNSKISYVFTESNGDLKLYPNATTNKILLQPSGGSVCIGGSGSMVFGVGDGAFDGIKYGTVQITQSDTMISSINNIAQIAFIRNANYVHGIGYKQSSNIFGFGQGVTSNFDPAYIAINPSTYSTGINNTNPAYKLDVNGLDMAVRSGYAGGYRYQWNYSGGIGESAFFNYRGLGSGAFWFKVLDTSNNDVGWAPIKCGNLWVEGSEDISSNGELLRLRGTDNSYIRYVVGGTNYAYTGFPGAGIKTFHWVNQISSGGVYGFLGYAGSTVDLYRLENWDGNGYTSFNLVNAGSYTANFGLGGITEPIGTLRDKFYIYKNGIGMTIDNGPNMAVGMGTATQRLDVNGNIRTRNSFTSNNVDFFGYTTGTFVPRMGILFTGNYQVYETNYPPAGKGPITCAYSIYTGTYAIIGNICTLQFDIAYSYVIPALQTTGQCTICVILPYTVRPANVAPTGVTAYPMYINDAYSTFYQISYWGSSTTTNGGASVPSGAGSISVAAGTQVSYLMFTNPANGVFTQWDNNNKSGQRVSVTVTYLI